jgi:ABC-2 type transport system permease protein
MKQMLALTRKELKVYFGSPMAAIFIGAFLLVSLFSFFWIETFFARNLADIRPLFRWMPLLLIFLVAALTMRQWSEEQRAGTMEVLLTLPVKLPQLVFGKFLAVLALVALALTLTLGLPITVDLLGDLDWGPVLGGYLGALLMAAAYIAIGLFVSSRTDNQIVALIVTVMLAGLFYLVGSAHITNFVGNQTGELLRSLGTGSRFASIERGVLDLRDIIYYLSLTGLFLTANVISLDQKRWSSGSNTVRYRRGIWLGAGLICANLLALNIWLHQINNLRVDVTENGLYSVSSATRDLIYNLEEPLLLRGYFSQRTHPLLAPLIPRIRDLMAEYQVVSGGNVEVSFVDPRHDEQLETEANRQYGIKPVPFQVSGRYEASVVNSYFHILVKYGDQHTTLSFNDLIETERRQDGQLEVRLRNLEYDLTRAIKKTVYGFQSLANVFAGINGELELTLIATPRSLPEPFAQLPAQIGRVAEELRLQADGKLAFSIIDPDHADGAGRQEVNRRYQIQPLSIPFVTEEPFYLHLFLTSGERNEPIYLTGEMGEAEIRHEIEGVLKRTASGFQKTVGLWTPQDLASMGMMMQAPAGEYRFFQQVLGENYNVEEVDLVTGRVAADIDVLLLVAPQEMSDLERFAVDQYLMRGGSVVALAGRYLLDIPPGAQSLNLRPVEDGITPLLVRYGINVEEALVMDRQNEPFPIPVNRDIGGFVVREIQQIEYPFFVDVRAKGMNRQSPVTASLPAVTMNWVSPVMVDPAVNSNRRVSTLLQSSQRSWLYTGTDIQPDFERYPRFGFAMGEPLQAYPLAVTVQGAFDSFFTEETDPRRAGGEKAPRSSITAGSESQSPLMPLIRRSPAAARLVVVGSAEFINDAVIGISQSIGQDRYLNSLEFLQNIIDWAVEDEELLTIRSRGSHARLLAPMTGRQETFWETFNYCLALAGLAGVSLAGIRRQRRERPLVLERVE